MRYAGVVAVSMLVAAVVYVVSLREPRDEAISHGFLPENLPAGGPVPGAIAGEHITYVPLAVAGRIPLRTRLAGLLGIVVLVAFSAAVLAFGLYQAGHLINQTIAKFFAKP